LTELAFAVTDPADRDRLSWVAGDGLWRDASWATLAAAIGSRPWVLLLDASQVSLFEITLPVRDLATARRAAPFAIEEQLAQPLDEIEIALAPRGGHVFAIAACARELIEDIRARLAAAGLHPELVVPAQISLPYCPQTLSIAVHADRALVRCGASSGVEVPLAGLADTVALLRQQLPDTTAANIYAAPGLADFPAAAFDGLTLAWHPPPSTTDMAAALTATPPPRLLDASHNAGVGLRARRLWQGAAVAALLVALAYPALLAFGNAALERSERVLSAANLTTFQAAFPEVTRVVNPRVQAGQALATLRAGAVTTPRFLDLLAAFDRAIAAELGVSTRVRSIAFAGGLLEISVETAGMGELERLRELLGAAGLGAEMLSAESTAEAVIARLRLKEPG
jgi:general secretion pathway protein L